jgi:hypothetical protein
MPCRRFARACAAILVLAPVLGGGEARAQGETSTGPQTQVWLNFTPGWAKGERWYWELDVEPKWQVSGGEKWRNFDLSPTVEYYPADWLDLEAEATVGNTVQKDGLDTFEITERVGARFHLFAKMAPHRPGIPGLEHERLPLTRLGLSTLVRLEQRNFWYSDDTPDKHEWRARLRLESKLAINHAKLSLDRTLYAIADAEYYQPLGDDIPERYVNKLRVRLGLGYRFRAATKLEFLYIRDWNRTAPDAEAAEDTQAFDLRVKLLF